MTDMTVTGLVALSQWIDGSPAYEGLGREAADWRRIAKVAEECGEVVSAYSGSLGENPRKGVTHTVDDVLKELLDVATAALGAYEHLTGNQGTSLAALDAHVEALLRRAGITREV